MHEICCLFMGVRMQGMIMSECCRGVVKLAISSKNQLYPLGYRRNNQYLLTSS